MKILDVILVSFCIVMPVYFSCNDRKHVKQEQPDIFSIAVWELVRREGIELNTYTCPAGYRTIGIGKRIDKNMSISFQEAKSMLYQDLQSRYDMVAKELPAHSRNEIMATTLLVYNIGLTNLKKQGQWDRIVAKSNDCEFFWKQYIYYKRYGRYKKSENLIFARNVEIAMWNNDTNELLRLQNELKTLASEKYENSY